MSLLNQAYIFGHRGCPRLAPENTMSSFHEIKKRNIAGVELDVQLSSDGEVMVFHDFTLDRITGESGKLTDYTSEKLRTLDAGSFFGKEFKGEKIPFLKEVFEMLADEETLFDIEIKTGGFENRSLCRELWRMILEFSLEWRCLISSFNPIALREFSKLKTGLPQAVIFAADIPWYLKKGQGRFFASSPVIKPDVNLLDTSLITKFRDKEKRTIFSWCVDERQRAKELLDLGISVISNIPDELSGN